MPVESVQDCCVAVRRLVAVLPMPEQFCAVVRSADSLAALAAVNDLTGTGRFSAIRARRFLRGRACAAQAMIALGIDPAPLPVGPDRAPAWPDSIVGSISHSAGVSVAVLSRSEHVSAIGVDLETSGVLPCELASAVSIPGELDGLDVSGCDSGLLLFSAKEAIFKCVSRAVGRFVGFHDVAVAIDRERMTFGVRWSALPAIQAIRHEISGCYRIDSGKVVTLAFRRAGQRKECTSCVAGTMSTCNSTR